MVERQLDGSDTCGNVEALIALEADRLQRH
jgi:hypothetical protein